MTREALKTICDGIIVDYPSEVINDKLVTKCNLACQKVCKMYGYTLFNGMTANEMASALQIGCRNWKLVSAEYAAAHAMNGGLAVAAKQYTGHGHIAIVAPRPCEMSGSWNKQVPIVANVGKTNGYMKVSQAFPVSDREPDYFTYEP